MSVAVSVTSQCQRYCGFLCIPQSNKPICGKDVPTIKGGKFAPFKGVPTTKDGNLHHLRMFQQENVVNLHHLMMFQQQKVEILHHLSDANCPPIIVGTSLPHMGFLIFLLQTILLPVTEDPRYNDTVCYQRFCCKIKFAVIKKLYVDPSKA